MFIRRFTNQFISDLKMDDTEANEKFMETAKFLLEKVSGFMKMMKVNSRIISALSDATYYIMDVM